MLLVVFILYIIAACAQEPEKIIETVIIEITSTTVPTSTPTETQEPTNTPKPTNTPLPATAQKEIPSPTPPFEPIIFTGTGDDVIDFPSEFVVTLARITGNANSQHFAVKSFDFWGDPIDLLVNTLDPYEGTHLLGYVDLYPHRFEVTATGEWKIEILSIVDAIQLDTPGLIEGVGDDVIVVTFEPDLAHIIGNEQAQHFAVKSYGPSRDLLVNTTDPYDGTVILDEITLFITFTATGPWSIEVTGR